jgi:hypothetical protein
MVDSLRGSCDAQKKLTQARNKRIIRLLPKTGFQAQELAPPQAQVPASKRKSWFSNARAGWKQEVPSFENESMPR